MKKQLYDIFSFLTKLHHLIFFLRKLILKLHPLLKTEKTKMVNKEEKKFHLNHLLQPK